MTQLNVQEPDNWMRQRLWENRVGDDVLLLDIVLCGRSPLGSVSMTGVATSTTTQSLLVSQDITVWHEWLVGSLSACSAGVM